jgi:hypothetical protein
LDANSTATIPSLSRVPNQFEIALSNKENAKETKITNTYIYNTLYSTAGAGRAKVYIH